ncbi:MAG: hypothetical protein RQ729_09725 [Wenzhouxiangellaceae bacterium]|nr:hypothetical protein [Wenzhouxiangellaceae bacterium]
MDRGYHFARVLKRIEPSREYESGAMASGLAEPPDCPALTGHATPARAIAHNRTLFQAGS